ncbi:MAG: Fe-S protein assembly co-chaperone HscB [Halioglobus sp.]|jgi:molecular chaperone HscB|nr:Fe-S protein assembly co-chaperone HscB [Halioglobus sp.]
MALLDFQRNYYQLFDLPQEFLLDQAQLGARYRQLQMELHPDRYASASAHEQRLAVQYSALVNAAYTALRKPLDRAVYLLELAGMGAEEISGQQVDGGFLIAQMELREKLESMISMVDPQTALDHLITEIGEDVIKLQGVFSVAYSAGEFPKAAAACVKMQYLDKLLLEAEILETSLLDG